MKYVGSSSRIFSVAPSSLSLFSFGRDWETYIGNVPRKVFEGVAFRVHAKAVLGILEYVVGTIKVDKEEARSHLFQVGETLQQLGARHVSYGMNDPAQYVVVQMAFFRVLQWALGDAWTPDVRQRWETVFKFVFMAMGAEAPGADVELVALRRTSWGGVGRATETVGPKPPCQFASSQTQRASWHSISRFQDSAGEKQGSIKNQAPRLPTRSSEWDVSQSSVCHQPPHPPEREAEEEDDANTVSTGCKVSSE